MQDLERFYIKIIESLKLIGTSDFEDTKSYFPDYVDLPFEVLDTYHNAFLLIPDLIDNNQFSNNTIANLIRLEILLNIIIKKPDFEHLNYEQLVNTKEWQTIINLAKETLDLIGIPLDKPDLDYI